MTNECGKEVFNKMDAVCSVCGTPITDPNFYCIGESYYCIDDYEKELEKPKNREKLSDNKKLKKLLKGFGGEL